MAELKRGRTTKSGGQKHPLDKFYTKPEVARWCLEQLDLSSFDLIIEPSAGDGSFSSQIPGVLAMDIQPESSDILEQDFFSYEKQREEGSKVLVVGNPPFGQQNTLAINFVNHAAKFADTIAFILPRSFMKENVQEKLHRNLHLMVAQQVPRRSFTLNGKDIDVPCYFQVWEYQAGEERTVPPMPVPVGFDFVKKTDNPDLFMRRIGGSAGKVGPDYEDKRPDDHYFIKIRDGFSLEDFLADHSKLVFPYRDFGTGPRSVTRKELLMELLENGSKFVKSDD